MPEIFRRYKKAMSLIKRKDEGEEEKKKEEGRERGKEERKEKGKEEEEEKRKKKMKKTKKRKKRDLIDDNFVERRLQKKAFGSIENSTLMTDCLCAFEERKKNFFFSFSFSKRVRTLLMTFEWRKE